MPYPRNDEKHLVNAVIGILRSVSIFLHTARAALAAPGKRGKPRMGALRPEHSTAMRSLWARYTPAQRAARIVKMRAGHAKAKRRRAAKK